MLSRDSLPGTTRWVFEHFAGDGALRDFTLIGGTALALQISHRLSEDLDFWLPMEQLDRDSVSSIIRSAQAAGFSARLVTPHHQIVSAKINGFDLLTDSQDYVVDGVKVTFFALNDVAFRYFDTLPRLTVPDVSFRIMGEDGLFAMKSYVIHRRVRSRDLFDLKAFLLRGKTIEDILDAGSRADPAVSIEYAKSVLIGEVPLDNDDEGFESIGLAETPQSLHVFFGGAVNAYEQAVAERIAGEVMAAEKSGASYGSSMPVNS